MTPLPHEQRSAPRLVPRIGQDLDQVVAREVRGCIAQLRRRGDSRALQQLLFALLRGPAVELDDARIPNDIPEAVGPGVVSGAEKHDLRYVLFERAPHDAIKKGGARQEELVGAREMLDRPLACGAVFQWPPGVAVEEDLGQVVPSPNLISLIQGRPRAPECHTHRRE